MDTMTAHFGSATDAGATGEEERLPKVQTPEQLVTRGSTKGEMWFMNILDPLGGKACMDQATHQRESGLPKSVSTLGHTIAYTDEYRKGLFKQAMTAGFCAFDKTYCNTTDVDETAGCVAVAAMLAFFKSGFRKLYVANVGDARAFLVKCSNLPPVSPSAPTSQDSSDHPEEGLPESSPLPVVSAHSSPPPQPPKGKRSKRRLVQELTVSHRPDVAIEAARLDRAKVAISEGKVHGRLSVTRALGCPKLKQKAPSGVLAVPHVFEHTIKPDDDFVLLGSAAFFVRLGEMKAVELARELLPHHGWDLDKVCKELLSRASGHGSEEEEVPEGEEMEELDEEEDAEADGAHPEEEGGGLDEVEGEGEEETKEGDEKEGEGKPAEVGPDPDGGLAVALLLLHPPPEAQGKNKRFVMPTVGGDFKKVPSKELPEKAKKRFADPGTYADNKKTIDKHNLEDATLQEGYFLFRGQKTPSVLPKAGRFRHTAAWNFDRQGPYFIGDGMHEQWRQRFFSKREMAAKKKMEEGVRKKAGQTLRTEGNPNISPLWGPHQAIAGSPGPGSYQPVYYRVSKPHPTAGGDLIVGSVSRTTPPASPQALGGLPARSPSPPPVATHISDVSLSPVAHLRSFSPSVATASELGGLL